MWKVHVTILTGYSGTRLRAGTHQQQFAAEGERRRIQIGIASRKIRIGVIPRLVVIVLNVQVLHLAVVDAQGAAGVVDVLPVERLCKEIVEFFMIFEKDRHV